MPFEIEKRELQLPNRGIAGLKFGSGANFVRDLFRNPFSGFVMCRKEIKSFFFERPVFHKLRR